MRYEAICAKVSCHPSTFSKWSEIDFFLYRVYHSNPKNFTKSVLNNSLHFLHYITLLLNMNSFESEIVQHYRKIKKGLKPCLKIFLAPINYENFWFQKRPFK